MADRNVLNWANPKDRLDCYHRCPRAATLKSLTTPVLTGAVEVAHRLCLYHLKSWQAAMRPDL